MEKALGVHGTIFGLQMLSLYSSLLSRPYDHFISDVKASIVFTTEVPFRIPPTDELPIPLKSINFVTHLPTRLEWVLFT